MTLKIQKLEQGATEMFISEFDKKKSLWNVMSEMYKNREAKKASFCEKRICVEWHLGVEMGSFIWN